MSHAMTNEEFVRSVWESVQLSNDGDSYTLPYVVFACAATERLGGPCKTETEVWAASAEFTRERQEQVRQLRRDISKFEYKQKESCDLIIATPANWVPEEIRVSWVRSLCSISRTLSHLRSELRHLTARMKDGAA